MEAKSEVEEEKKEEDVASAGGWSFSSFLQTAKQKSSEAYEFMKRDLTEFKDTVQNDTVSAVSSTATYIRTAIQSLSIEEEEEDADLDKSEKQEIKEKEVSASTLDNAEVIDQQTNQSSIEFIEEKAKGILSSVVEIFKGTVFPSEEEEEICMVVGSRVVNIPIERWNILVTAVQNDPQTYIREPQGPPDSYESWLSTFNLIDHESEMKQLLATVPDVNNFYMKLVPSSITHDEFWRRYYYRIHQLVLLEELRKEKMSLKVEEEPEDDNIKTSTEQPKDENNLNDDELKVTTKETTDMVVVKRKGDESTSSSPSEATKASEGSEDWEKTELSEIVDEAAKRVSEKLNGCDEKQCPEEFNEWEFQ